jgi:hypothetical protein
MEIISTLNTGNQVEYTNEQGKKVSIPYRSSKVHNYRLNTYYIAYTSSIPVNFFTSAGTQSTSMCLTIDPESMDRILDAKTRLLCNESTNTGGNTVSPTAAPYFFNYIQVYANNGSGDLITTMYNDTMLWNTMLLSSEQFTTVAAEMNTTTTYGGGVTIGTGLSKNFYIEHIGTFFDTIKPYVKNLKSKILLRYYPMTKGAISTSTTTNNLTVSALELSFEHEKMSNEDILQHDKEYSETLYKNIYLDPVLISTPIVNLTASKANIQVDLSTLVGSCAFIIFCVRSTPLAANNGVLSYLDLGDDATIDIKFNSERYIGSGSAVNARELRNRAAKYLPSTLCYSQPIYPIPFCGSMINAFKGVIDGGFNFNLKKYVLEIVPGAAWSTSTVQIDLYAYMYKQFNFYNGDIKISNVDINFASMGTKEK